MQERLTIRYLLLHEDWNESLRNRQLQAINVLEGEGTQHEVIAKLKPTIVRISPEDIYAGFIFTKRNQDIVKLYFNNIYQELDGEMQGIVMKFFKRRLNSYKSKTIQIVTEEGLVDEISSDLSQKFNGKTVEEFSQIVRV